MELTINYDELKNISDALKKSAEYIEKELNYAKWSLNISSAEQLLLYDYFESFRIQQSGLSEEEYNRFYKISDNYSRIIDFYDNEVETIKRELSAGFERYNIPFDINITKEQAFEKYCGCDEETAKKANDLIYKIRLAESDHKKELMDNYKGDLFVQLGRENERSVYEERVKARQEKINELKNDLMTKRQETNSEISQGVSSYTSFVESTVKDYEEQNKDGLGPTL